MPILNIDTDSPGQVGVIPRIIHINTSDSLATIVASGYLNKAVQNGLSVSNGDIALVYGTDVVDGSAGSEFFQVRVSGSDTSLVASVEPGSVVLPVTENHIAAFTDSDGTIGDDPATAINGGNIQAGLSGTAGYLASFPGEPNKGSLHVAGVANVGDTVTTISNSTMGQASVVSIPDPGAATANFLLDSGASNVIEFQQFVGLDSYVITTAGLWTPTRPQAGIVYLTRTPAASVDTVVFEVTPQIRAASDKGFQLNSFDVVYNIGTASLNAHTVGLYRTFYVDNDTTTTVNTAVTGVLGTASRVNDYVTNVTVDTPSYLNTNVSQYFIEITVDAALASIYSISGINLHFDQTIA